MITVLLVAMKLYWNLINFQSDLFYQIWIQLHTKWQNTEMKCKKRPILYEETVYFLPLSFQKFLVLIWSTLERWKAESTLEPPSGFEHGTSGLGIQHLSHHDTIFSVNIGLIECIISVLDSFHKKIQFTCEVESNGEKSRCLFTLWVFHAKIMEERDPDNFSW